METSNVSPFLTFLSDIWNSFLPEKVGIRSWGMKKDWKLHTCIQTVSQKDINVYLLIWETE